MDTKPKELLQILEDDGWRVVRIKGSHHIMKHPTKPGMITLPMHNKDMKPGTYNTILKQAGLK
ncbi:MAG: type II toxin-antitoxin system HicA family toxin [Anaerovibrio sp.]|uniref:type II toxin-antitoxin system HicA family toxin n=1 Tax=Anaerovibrio sp. TaxID=1872532 RepID=UPI0025E37F75|nr:type II toxin-antitoxin system HicA family toxin [Anaerovibrio sp.]MCR5177323.1 type II toxin-antitoxin system HicA family toxin [Anaerovibrio sp.]